MADYQPVKSSFIESARYDPANKIVHVRFKSGKDYKYEGVPQKLYDEFAATFDTEDSSGKFLNARLKEFAQK